MYEKPSFPYCVWDVETTIFTSYKRKGNPFDPRNFVVMSGFKHTLMGSSVFGDYYGVGKRPRDWFIKLLQGHKLLVGQNIKFDLLHAFMDEDWGKINHEAWMEWVANGGMVWDIQLAEYLLEGMTQASQMMSLDELAPQYGGNVKFDEVKALWEAGVQTYDIDVDLLRRYLVGTPTEHGDIGNTELVFIGQYHRAKAAGQIKSILLNMGSLLYTIEAEFNGMAVDKEEGIRQAAILEKQIQEMSVELAGYLPPDLPFRFNWNSGTHKSAIIFGGKVKYQKWVQHQDEEGNLLFARKKITAVYLEDGTLFPLDAWNRLDNPEEGDPPTPQCLSAVVMKSGKNAGELKTKQIEVPDYTKPKGAKQDFFWKFPGYTTPRPEWKGAVEGVYSTKAEVIADLGNRGIPFLETLSKLVGMTKDLTTYYIVIDEETGEATGMLTLVQLDGIIHHSLNHTSTITARFSSSNPNLQNIPKEGKSVVKMLFISRFKGGKIIQSDFTALEVYIQAILTKCPQLIKDLLAGLDMHCVRVSQTYNITYEEALRLCVTEKVGDWPKKRTKAKVFSFQRAYGAGAQKISDSVGMPIEEVEALIAAENTRYPEIEKFYAALASLLDTHAQQSGIVIPHPDINGLTCFLRKAYYRTPDNKLYSYREHPAPKWIAEKPASKGGRSSSFSPTEVKNYIVQGEGGEWAKAAMWLAVREFYRRGNFGGKGLLVNQVHDALYADADPSVALETAAVLEAAMLCASEFMEWYFDWPVPCPVPSATAWGANMMEEHAMPEGFTAVVAQERLAMRQRYLNNYIPSFETAPRYAA
ncbi:DNA-directed DNA polymerase [Caulobacter phage DCM]|uniref:DNA polymerase n=1 Tax=Caulobacter phage DCM TaxID=3020391 RepID=A0AAE9WZD4_9CAUD|nr:DNA-directed DNA polymerase [Caulobacter phage DCM]WCD56103.1 DNA-directed DNA polymerase [Caulobacter phage BL199]